MQVPYTNYAFSKSQIRILRELSKGRLSLPQIEKSLSIKPSLLSQNLKKLQKKGLIQTSAEGNRKYAQFSETKHASLLRDLFISYDYMNWENILMGKTIEILFHALAPKDENLSGFSKATLWRYLKILQERGTITQTEKRYQINPNFSILIDFLKEYQRYFSGQLSKALSENSVILWQENMEFLVRAPKNARVPSKDFHKTATSIFPQFDLSLFSEYNIYLYSTNKKTIKPEDAILHTLLIEPDNVRYTTYALLLLKRIEKQIDKNYLLQEAERFGLKNRILGMFQFLETHTRKDRSLPTWNEFLPKAEEYGLLVE